MARPTSGRIPSTHARSNRIPTPIVVFSDVDGIRLKPETSAFERAAHLLEHFVPGGVALVLCSGKTRAELEYIQRGLRIHDPFVCEFGVVDGVGHHVAEIIFVGKS